MRDVEAIKLTRESSDDDTSGRGVADTKVTSTQTPASAVESGATTTTAETGTLRQRMLDEVRARAG
jgi:hypothetical protein